MPRSTIFLGLELTFFRGLKLTRRWDIAPSLYALPFPMLKQQLKRRVQRIPDSLLYRIDPGQEHSVAVLVSEIRWGPVIVSTKGRTLSDPYPVETKIVFDHNPLLLVALMAVTLQRPLWILFNTLRAEPWVEDFLNVEGGGGSFFPSPTQLEPQTFPEPDLEATKITERAFRQWDLLPSADRAVLALAITRLSESLSRTGMLAEQDRVLDVSIALEILYRLDHLEITYKHSSRAGWYLGPRSGRPRGDQEGHYQVLRPPLADHPRRKCEARPKAEALQPDGRTANSRTSLSRRQSDTASPSRTGEGAGRTGLVGDRNGSRLHRRIARGYSLGG